MHNSALDWCDQLRILRRGGWSTISAPWRPSFMRAFGTYGIFPCPPRSRIIWPSRRLTSWLHHSLQISP